MPTPAIADDASIAIRQLLDRQAISDCLLRYTRGADRLDVALLRSAFHDDAIDRVGTHAGTVEEFLARWLPQQEGRQAQQHYLTNTTIDLDGDVAHVESYFLAIIKLRDSEAARLSGGRYADRFERRNGEWKIAVRVVLSEWGLVADASAMTGVARPDVSHRDRNDITYLRPLVVPPTGTGS